MEEFSVPQRAFAELIGTALLVFVGAGLGAGDPAARRRTKAPFSGADLGFISMAFGLIVSRWSTRSERSPAVTSTPRSRSRSRRRSASPGVRCRSTGGRRSPAASPARSRCGRPSAPVRSTSATGSASSTSTTRSRRWGSAMFIEALGTGILLFTILGIVDTRSPEGWAGLVIGLVIVAIIITVGPVTNASLNPARAIGPLFVSTIHGGVHNWTQQFLAYIPANLIGATVAAASPTTGWRRRARLSARSRKPSPSPTAPTHSPTTPTRSGPIGRIDGNRDPDDEEVHQRPGGRRQGVARRPRRRASGPRPGRLREPDRRPQGRAGEGQGRRSSRAAARATSRCTEASSASACSTPPVRARSSPRRCPTRCSPRRRPSTAAPGVVHIVKNYTGDVMNFKLAAELAEDEGIKVESVLTNDDVAVEDSALHGRAPRRRRHRAPREDRRREGRGGRIARRGGRRLHAR